MAGSEDGRKRTQFKKGNPGKPFGALHAAGRQKENMRAALREKVFQRWGPMIDAQLDNAIGLKHFMLRDPKTGQFKRIVDPDEIDAALKDGAPEDGSHFYIYTKDPNGSVAADLMNRVIDKPVEPVDMGVSGSFVLKWEGEK